MADGVVDEVLGLLDTHAAVSVFDSNMFDSIWRDNDTPKAVQKCKLQEAGLVPTLAKKSEGKNRMLWTQKGVTLKAPNGIAPVLTLADGFSTSLKTDLGYQHVLNGKTIAGWREF